MLLLHTSAAGWCFLPGHGPYRCYNLDWRMLLGLLLLLLLLLCCSHHH